MHTPATKTTAPLEARNRHTSPARRRPDHTADLRRFLGNQALGRALQANPGLQPMLQPHATIGNHALGQAIQTKLSVSQPGDAYEREADHIADRVMRSDAHVVQRKCASCDSEDEKVTVQRQAGPSAQPSAGAVPASHVESALRDAGQPIDPAARRFFEPKFGRDFSNVRVHTGSHAAKSAGALGALAYTLGNDVVFAPGQYNTETSRGRHLLAHELTHVVQQGGHPARISRFKSGDIDTIDPSNGDDPAYTFSSNCGWIDWSHVGLVKEATELIAKIQKASDALKATGSSATAKTGETDTPALESKKLGLVFDSTKFQLRLLRPLTSKDEVNGASLSIWKRLSVDFEINQEWAELYSHSSFSQEDLPSNLIAFYMAALPAKITESALAGSWTGGTKVSKEKWKGRDRSGGFCAAWDRKASKAEYDRNPFAGKKNHTFDPVGATGAWPAELSSIIELPDVYEIKTISLANQIGAYDFCPLYRLEGEVHNGFFSNVTFGTADNVRVAPTLEVQNLPPVGPALVEVKPYDGTDSAKLAKANVKWPLKVPPSVLICLTDKGNPV